VRFPLMVALLFLSLYSLAQSSAPEMAVSKHFEYFNEANKKALNAASDSPFVFSISGERIAYAHYGDSVDFDGLRGSGWAYSRINRLQLLYEDDSTAMVDVNFSRFNAADNPISTTQVVFLLVWKDNAWKLKAGFVDGDLTLGK